ncbi:hypothetical protein GCM10022237_46200 [Nocardioides ginsengisoli]|uniref:Uncharacterized protein n=1 Tax=Nocardioides ginsengisoli TaxID=363868 RepID=A0ABW3W6G8_9ACTN
MTEVLTIRGSLDLWSETGTEGGFWAVFDERASHDEVERCPWSPDHPLCPGTRAYWEHMSIQPDDFAHGNYAGLWILESGHHLRVFDRENRVRILLDWDVRLVEQANQYSVNALSARGWVIHSYPADVDLDRFADLAFAHYPALLTVPRTKATTAQDALCAELRRLALADEPMASPPHEDARPAEGTGENRAIDGP